MGIWNLIFPSLQYRLHSFYSYNQVFHQILPEVLMRLPKDYSSLERRGGCSGVAMLLEQKIAEKTRNIGIPTSHIHLRYEIEEE